MTTVNGKWTKAGETEQILDPLNGEVFLHMPATQSSELQPFVDSMGKCPKHGLHNPFKNVQRCVSTPFPSLSAYMMRTDPTDLVVFCAC